MQDDRLLGIAKVMGLLVKMSAGLALQMSKKGTLPSEDAKDFAILLRELAKLYQDGDEETATGLWTTANLLERPGGAGSE